MTANATYVYLIRHAHAGNRQHDERDRYRPLSEKGRDRAKILAKLFDAVAVDRIVASPATRCQQTLEPLAAMLGDAVTECEELWEGSSTIDALDFLGTIEGQHVVACSHGDIIPAVIDQLVDDGVPVKGRSCELGSIWLLERRGPNEWRSARYLSPKDSLMLGQGLGELGDQAG